MRSPLLGVCLSGYNVSSSAFILRATTCGAIARHPMMLREGLSKVLGRREAHNTNRRVSAQAHYYHDSRGVSSYIPTSATNNAEVEMGQDAGEMFDVFLPPDSLSALTEPPQPAGFSKARGLVHADGDWHRSVHIWLHNSKGELVLQKRSASKDTFPGMWDVSVGGHFTAGEGSLETAIKETSEELGLTCDESSLRFVCTVSTTATGSTPMHGDFVCNEYKDIYLLRYDGPLADLNFAPSEVEDVKSVPMGQLRDIFAAQDPGYIPRPDYYTEVLFKALEEEIM